MIKYIIVIAFSMLVTYYYVKFTDNTQRLDAKGYTHA